jgi:pyruvate kinase
MPAPSQSIAALRRAIGRRIRVVPENRRASDKLSRHSGPPLRARHETFAECFFAVAYLGMSMEATTCAVTANRREVLDELERVRAEVERARSELLARWARPAHGSVRASVANLAAYIALRRNDLSELQVELAARGLSSLGRSEAHVVETLDAVIEAARGTPGGDGARVRRAMQEAAELLRARTDALLGPPPGSRWTRFMVTLPTRAAEDPEYVRELVKRGMDCARVNLAHDEVQTWGRMVENVRRAARDTGRACPIVADLCGPKLRIGAIAPGPAILRVKPERDHTGRVVRPGVVVLDGSGRRGEPGSRDEDGCAHPPRLAVTHDWLATLEPGDELRFRDVRGRRRCLVVETRAGADEVLCSSRAGAWIAAGTTLERCRNGRSGPRIRSGAFAAAPAEIRVRPGDELVLTRDDLPGEPARLDPDGRVVAPAHVPCSEPAVFPFLAAGQRVWIDDGRIEAVIESMHGDGAHLRVTRARATGDAVRGARGLNFPESKLELPGLTDHDLADLDFAAQRADLIGLSFVQGAADVDRLAAEIAARGRPGLGIIAKIETQQGIDNLPEILVHGMAGQPFGIMIARGDLAVEIGYERLAEMQEEMLWLCEAAHVPVIWATQVLETLVKSHLPSRAEITDAAMAERAECILLNKGPYVFEALAVLENVVARMERHQKKKTAQLRALGWWERAQSIGA